MIDLHDDPRPVIIVGGGLAGLTTAAYLARAGRAVMLFEQSAQLGGAATTQNQAGYAFNRGLHALYSGGATSEVLRELGVTYSYGVPKSAWLLQRGVLHSFPDTPRALLRTSFVGLRDKLAMLRLFARLPRMTPSALAHISVADWIAQTTDRPQLRALFSAIARTFVYSAALDLVSAEVFVDKLQRSLHHPIQYVDGGWQTLVDGLRQVAEQAGAQIISGARVHAVIHESSRATGVWLQDGRALPAAAVVLAVRPADTLKLLDAAAAPALHRTVAQLLPAPIACLDVALAQLPNAQYPVVQDTDQARFISAQSVYAQVAPDQGALIGVFKQLDPRQPSDPHADQRALEDLLDTVQPGWRAVLIRRAFLPHIDACGGLPTAQAGGFAGRPQPHAADLEQLYLAGDWIGAAGFLADASFASARQVAGLVLRDQQQSSPALLAQFSQA